MGSRDISDSTLVLNFKHKPNAVSLNYSHIVCLFVLHELWASNSGLVLTRQLTTLLICIPFSICLYCFTIWWLNPKASVPRELKSIIVGQVAPEVI